ncbi:MAG TPA: hypothetical protein VJN18_09315 [Polyangiaceae bacterium]|nr:hypothetical protein [Polyangiaceae bacterium]
MYSSPTHLLVSLLCLAGLDTACRGRLPPTEPPRFSDDGVPAARTNDAPMLDPLTGEGVMAPAGKGGTNVLPPLPGPGPAGTSSGGSAGSDR